QIDLLGTTMGSPEDFAGMARLVEEKRLQPVIDTVYPLDQGSEALARMDAGEQYGKIVLRIEGG
ncbi:MAG TPA: zinc-binding dehydrogenase, partial [Fibrobacteria bacterium]|nr:zinc-binding dehydrogenase [Fibrobacteria bacterium]